MTTAMGYENGPTYIGTLRHFEDDVDNSGSNRDPGIKDCRSGQVSAVTRDIVEAARSLGKKRVGIVTSPLVRAVQTVDAIQERISDTGISVGVVEDHRLAALKHGRYFPHYDPNVEAHAWNAYVSESFNGRGIEYRHGNPLGEDGNYKYPEVAGKFSSWGENQKEFTIRTYAFLFSLADAARKGQLDDRLLLVVAHTAIIMRIMEMSILLKNDGNVPLGEMYMEEWNMGDRVLENSANKAAINPGGFGMVDVSPIIGHRTRIGEELDHLRRIIVP